MRASDSENSLTVWGDRRGAHQDGKAECKKMIDHNHELPVVWQCRLLELSRSTAYYRPRTVSEENLALMRRMDELHMDWPSFGSRGLLKLLWQEGRTWRLTTKRRRSLIWRKCLRCIVQRRPTIAMFLLKRSLYDKPEFRAL